MLNNNASVLIKIFDPVCYLKSAKKILQTVVKNWNFNCNCAGISKLIEMLSKCQDPTPSQLETNSHTPRL